MAISNAPDYLSNTAPADADTVSGMWYPSEIDEPRWSQKWPYQLLVLTAQDDGSYTRDSRWQFTLPITPQDMGTVTVLPFQISATLNGAFEQVGKLTFKDFTVSGTFGVLPNRGGVSGLQNTGLAGAIFGGTVSNAQSSVARFKSAAGIPSFKSNLYSVSDIAAGSTGYAQSLLLEQFLETYTEAKTREAGKRLRLAFAVWKDNHIYLVSPRGFQVRKTAGSPHERYFTLAFRAFKRVNPTLIHGLGYVTSSRSTLVNSRDPNLVAKVLGTIDNARNGLSQVSDTIQSISSDLNRTVFEVVRQVILAAKDVVNVGITLAELPASIIQRFNSSIVSAVKDLRATVKEWDNAQKELFDLFDRDPDAAVAEVSGNPAKYASFLSKLPLSNLRTDLTTRQMVDDELSRVRDLTRRDFEQMRDTLRNSSDAYAASVGLGNDTYNRTFGVTTTKVRDAMDSDYNVLFSLSQMVQSMGSLAAYKDVRPASYIPPIEYLAGIAANSGIAVKVPNSKYAVPMPYSFTLEQVAAIYLGDPLRWLEIAALNNLRTPYVDEVGFDLPLLANGRMNQVSVSDVTNVEKGQTVWIMGDGELTTKRHVMDIRKVSDGNYVLTLDGDPSLDSFKTLANAKLHTYLPHTVNSQMLVFVPSDKPTTVPDNLKQVPGVDYYDQLTRVGGMDLLLDSKNHLVITSDGDGKIAFGLTNIIQTARIAMSTPRGALKLHPGFGFGIKKGTSTADATSQDILSAAKTTFAEDDTFTGVENANVTINGPSAKISLTLGVRGSDYLLPVTFDVPLA